MRRMVLTLAVLAIVAAPATSQQRGRGGFGQQSPLMLLAQKSVQEELKMTEEQVGKATEAVTKQREAMQGLGDLSQEERGKKMRELTQEGEKTVKEILKPEQATRLRQVSLQVQGGRALATPAVAKDLNLTDEQKQKVKDMLAESQEKIRDIFQNAGDDREAAMKKIQELNKETSTKMIEMLNDEQKTKWKEMTGKPFTGTITFGQRRN